MKWTLTLLGAIVASGLLFGWSLNAPAYHGTVSDHFDGAAFRNTPPVSLPSPSKAVRYFFETNPGEWDEWRDNPPPDRVLERSSALRVTYINHATTLIQMDSLNILTDPIYSNRPSPVTWMGPTRRHAPGLAIEALIRSFSK